MTNNDIPKSHDLVNKPLVEALFELKWKLDEQSSKGQAKFPLLLGRYFDKIRKRYPEAEDLPASQVPETFTPHIVRHRFRVGAGQWPVTQLGPGILTVNETQDYHWDTFRERIAESLEAVFSSYPMDVSQFSPLQVELRYINLIPFDKSAGKITDFLSCKLHTTITVDERIFDGDQEAGIEAGLDFSIALQLKKPDAIGTLMFGNGESDNRPGLLWQIIMRTNPANVPQTSKDIMQWTNEAHEVTEKWFFTLARGDLMELFDRVAT